MFYDFTQYQIILIPLLIVGFTGLLLSLGSNGYIGKIYSFLIDDVPFLRGMREPQKFLSLYVLSFTVFFAFSLSLIKKVLDKVAEHYSADKVLNFIFKKTICLTFTLVIIFASFPIFFGAKHQLTLTDYPVIFSDFNELLKKEEGKERVLVLPWQNYMDFQWTQRRIADPSIRYFDAEIISRDKDSIFKDLKCDIEFKIDSGAENGTKYEGCFNYTDDPYVFSRTLKLLNIKYIIRHDVDIDTEVLNLLDKDYFEVVMSDGNMTVYRVNDQ